jgi:hypothetical protein
VAAEAVSSNATQSIFIIQDNYGIKSGFVLRSCPTECLAIEEAEWKPFTNALDKSDRKEFDDMFDISRLYISACSNSVQLVPLHPIMISILFHHYKQLTECIE